jgi:hypothetical protein
MFQKVRGRRTVGGRRYVSHVSHVCPSTDFKQTRIFRCSPLVKVDNNLEADDGLREFEDEARKPVDPVDTSSNAVTVLLLKLQYGIRRSGQNTAINSIQSSEARGTLGRGAMERTYINGIICSKEEAQCSS